MSSRTSNLAVPQCELGRRDEIDIEQAVAVVVEERDAGARGLEDVILRRAAAIAPGGQARALFERNGNGRPVIGRHHGGGRRPHR